MNRFARLIERWDAIEPSRLLRWHAVIAALVLIVRVGFLLSRGSNTNPDGPLSVIYFILATCSALLVSALLAWARPEARVAVLRFHCILLLLVALYFLWSATSWMVGGIPKASRFSWNPVLFAFVVAYPVYLARRVLVPETMRGIWIVHYSHILVAGLSIIISAGIFWHVWHRFP